MDLLSYCRLRAMLWSIQEDAPTFRGVNGMAPSSLLHAFAHGLFAWPFVLLAQRAQPQRLSSKSFSMTSFAGNLACEKISPLLSLTTASHYVWAYPTAIHMTLQERSAFDSQSDEKMERCGDRNAAPAGADEHCEQSAVILQWHCVLQWSQEMSSFSMASHDSSSNLLAQKPVKHLIRAGHAIWICQGSPLKWSAMVDFARAYPQQSNT